MIPQQTQYPYGVTLAPVRVRHVGSYCSVCFREVSELYREWGALASKIATALKRSLLKRIRIFRTWSRLFDLVVGEFTLELNCWGLHSSLERERKFRQRVVTSSITRRIRKFTSWSCSDGQRNVPNSVLHVQIVVLLMKPIGFYALFAVAIVVVRAL